VKKEKREEEKPLKSQKLGGRIKVRRGKEKTSLEAKNTALTEKSRWVASGQSKITGEKHAVRGRGKGKSWGRHLFPGEQDKALGRMGY